MVTIFLWGLLTSGLSLALSLGLAAGIMWTRRHLKFWSPLFSDADLRRLGLYSTAMSAWPFVSSLAGAFLAPAFGSPPLTVAMTAATVSCLGLGISVVYSLAEEKARYAVNMKTSEKAQKELAPLIHSRWIQLGGAPDDIRVEVRAFCTPHGTQGSVTLSFPVGRRPSSEIIARLYPAIPSQYKIRIDTRHWG